MEFIRNYSDAVKLSFWGTSLYLTAIVTAIMYTLLQEDFIQSRDLGEVTLLWLLCALVGAVICIPNVLLAVLAKDVPILRRLALVLVAFATVALPILVLTGSE